MYDDIGFRRTSQVFSKYFRKGNSLEILFHWSSQQPLPFSSAYPYHIFWFRPHKDVCALRYIFEPIFGHVSRSTFCRSKIPAPKNQPGWVCRLKTNLNDVSTNYLISLLNRRTSKQDTIKIHKVLLTLNGFKCKFHGNTLVYSQGNC